MRLGGAAGNGRIKDMGASNYKELLAHAGHQIAVVSYGPEHEHENDPANAAVECETCNEVLLDYDREPEESPEIQALLDKIEGHAERDDIVESMDDFVCDVVSKDASAINNSGVGEQLRYLMRSGVKLGELREAIGVDLGR
jgi:hypothetical protein